MENKFATARITAAEQPLRTRITLSGDKSVSIRRALFSLLESRPVSLENFGTGADCQTALTCIETLGKHVKREGNLLVISGEATRSGTTLDCRNSGTTARMLMGMLAGREGEWKIIGDESLSRRPMGRVAEPLQLMGARIDLHKGGSLPARVLGSDLQGREHDLPFSSAQVKSALLLAGLFARGMTRVREPFASRDHTERLLGLRQSEDGYWSVMREMTADHTPELSGLIPGDLSSAAFWAVAALLVPDSEISIENVLLNPLRAGWFEILRRAGANVSASVSDMVCAEPMGTITVRAGKLSPMHVKAAEVPTVIDEIPALAVLAASIDGDSVFEQVGELRLKESDRLTVIAENVNALGAKASVRGDNLHIRGVAKLQGAAIDTQRDHRIAMAFALAGLVAKGELTIQQADCAAISYPEFFRELSQYFTNSVSLT